ncbi:hypothetical protein [Piscirickettsia litoralis]|uniref:Uncharacterized protein n=1 Tax=Piscirickettsia litoralis TaxID=1891921 RepID=A0ABX2ZX58_9GAMM|nr:hypothetical protein [Piscirickettsia litoralis]ODN41202.1 hypothetical protein BGC07_17465 [Piscirickettsia litoralis]
MSTINLGASEPQEEESFNLDVVKEQNKHELSKVRLTFAKYVLIVAFLTLLGMVAVEIWLPGTPATITGPIILLASNVITLVLGYYFGKGGD